MKPLNIIVCGSIVPDPLQTLEPVETPQGPALKNEQMLPAVLDPWAACALYEAAHLAASAPGSQVTLVSAGPAPKLRQLMMSVAQKAPFALVAVNAPAGGFADARATAAELAKAIKAIPGLDMSNVLLFGGCSSAARDAGVTMQFLAEELGISEFFQAVDELKFSEDGSFTVLERIEGGSYLKSSCKTLPAAIGWATGSLPEPPNNPRTGMMNMPKIMAALAKAQPAAPAAGGAKYLKTEIPSSKRDTRIVKDMPEEEIAREIVQWIRG